MATYAELHQELAKALAAAQRLEGRIAELELNLEAIDYEHAAQCAADDQTL
jgi:hypothetical protein